MTEYLFLIYIPDFFGVEGTYVKCFDCEGNLTGSELPSRSPEQIVISYEVATLIDEYRRIGADLPETLVDVSEALRLISGRARDEGAEKSWSFYRKLKQNGSQSHVIADFVLIAQGRKSRPTLDELDEMMLSVAQLFKTLWLSTNDDLKSKGEFNRFWNVEVPFAQICWYRQWSGVKLNASAVGRSLKAVREEKYSSYRRLAELINISPSGLSFRNVRTILKSTDLGFLLDTEENANLEAEFRLAADVSEFAAAFLTYVRSSRDEYVLSRVAGNLEKVHPTFQPMGTVTGRTLVSDPHLQNLRRAYRGIIGADPGMHLVYLDFRQYEPGIAAYLSKDNVLIGDYNNSDVYTILSEHVFGTAEKRALTKRAFVSYLYGMSEERIGQLLAGADEQSSLSQRLSAFFARYDGLRAFRTACQNELFRRGYIGTLEGNHRRRLASGHLTSKERRWAANQPIQGTASLILKDAMLSIRKALGVQSLIMPLHDAVLLQIDSKNFDASLSESIRSMKAAFNLRCPGIRCEISVSSFDEQEPTVSVSQ